MLPPVSKVEALLKNVTWPDSWPYSVEDFSREDDAQDEEFYAQPRFCAHVDASFIATLRRHYEGVFQTYPNARILDMCSSWISHYPEEKTWSHVSITGMNEDELKRNEQADDYVVRNLNTVPELPYDSDSFDVVTCAVSFDYLVKPLEVMREVARVLKPGGVVILSTSNRCFPSKAVKIWSKSNSLERILIFASYMYYADMFETPEALDLSPLAARGLGLCDPVYVVQARKHGGSPRSGREESEPVEVERVPGLRNWLEARGLARHLERVIEWCDEMGAADFVEVAENAVDLADYLGGDMSREERTRLLRGTQ